MEDLCVAYGGMWGRISWCGMGEDEFGITGLVSGEIIWGVGARRVLTGECGGGIWRRGRGVERKV
ncbi:hypothetical protein [Bartonella sp. AU15XJBT]|uniref:hypothetical protein n=1 Tax=Bartonella sp. AU15XJBT TaxID=3019087 RepID=UPI00235E7D25|nr:hypothetical protein [Bartonella sp. AU15XJBT]